MDVLKSGGEFDADATPALLEALFAHSPVGFAFVDADLTFRRVSPQLARLNGVPAEAHLGRPIAEILGPERWAARRPLFEKALAGEAVVDALLPALGGRHVLASYYPVPGKHGLAGIVVIVRDDTERVEAERAENRYAVALENMLDALIICDPDGTIQEVNEAFVRHSGYSRAEAVGQKVQMLHRPEDQARIMPAIAEGVRREGRWSGEVAFVRKDGTEGVSETTIVPLTDEQGQVIALVGANRDVTERKRTEQRLEESEQRYRSLFDHNSRIVCSFDLRGRFVSANAACEAICGYTPDELLTMDFTPLVPPDERERVGQFLQQALSGDSPTYETTIVHKTGRRVPLRITNVPIIVGGAVVGVYGIAEDITDQRRAEQAIRDAARRRLAILREVLASVTEGKLRLVGGPSQLPAPLTPFAPPIGLTPDDGLTLLRKTVTEAARQSGHPEDRRHDLVTAASEAGMNAIVHAGGGQAVVGTDPRGIIQVRVQDRGRGISLDTLPQAALSRGFSTRATLGHGLKMMLEMVDRLSLLTGRGGTTIVLEQEKIPPLPAWLERRLAEEDTP